MNKEYGNNVENLHGMLYPSAKYKATSPEMWGYIKIQNKVYQLGAWDKTEGGGGVIALRARLMVFKEDS